MQEMAGRERKEANAAVDSLLVFCKEQVAKSCASLGVPMVPVNNWG
jgi:hypothetical protein